MCAKKISITLDDDVLGNASKKAKAAYGDNLSKAINEMLREQFEAEKGPMSKVFQFYSDVRGTLAGAGLETQHVEHAVDWIIPSLRLGLEAKVKFTPGKPESATVAAMAYTMGQKLCDEIWIVCADAMPQEHAEQWERVAREFHLAPVRVVRASSLVALLNQRGAKGNEPRRDSVAALEKIISKSDARHQEHRLKRPRNSS